MGRRPWKRDGKRSSRRNLQVTPTRMSVYAMNNPCPYRASVSSPCSDAALAVTPQPQQDNHLLKVFSSLFESGKYSDLVIKCQGQRWKVHRVVVCTQSRPLAAAIDGNFRESATGEIDLEEDDPQIVGFVLEYFYKGDVSINANIGTSENPIDLESTPQSFSSPPINMDARMFPRQYQGGPYVNTNQMSNPVNNPLHNPANNPTNAPTSALPFGYQPVGPSNQRPSILSFHSMHSSASPIYPPNFGTWNGGSDNTPKKRPSDIPPPNVAATVNPQNLVTLAAIYVVAEKYDVQPLKLLAHTKYEAILPKTWNTKHFVESLELIYDGLPEMSEPDSLRELAIKTAAAHGKELMDRGEFMTLCKERGDIGTDIFKASLYQTPAQPQAAPAQDGGRRFVSCKINSNHSISIFAVPTYPGGPNVVRYRCAVCDTVVE